eukprot:TRINITY_DN12086_c0_g1_i4.p3 TRINITY_DN12086_c0_g1~~TRINITY_DN12086_c0_g1_i4.p3  ORF type:complete len:122 (+),score=28.45 TRINITY_DN12086_c0_g1_i4:2489-2854(+)
MTAFDVDRAIKLAQDDQLWTLQHTERQPDTIHDFLQRLVKGVGECHACQQPLDSDRTSCAKCGHFFCGKCQKNRRECQNSVSKAMLGATNPETRHDEVAVCRDCYQTVQTELLTVIKATKI